MPRVLTRGQSRKEKDRVATVNTSGVPAAAKGEASIAAVIARSVLWLVWQALRLPVFALLVIFEPIVRLLLSWLTLLAVLTAFLFESSSAASSFPFWGISGNQPIMGRRQSQRVSAAGCQAETGNSVPIITEPPGSSGDVMTS